LFLTRRNWMRGMTVLSDLELTGESSRVLPASKDVVVLSTFFNPDEHRHAVSPARRGLSEKSVELLSRTVSALRAGGLLFVYGPPHHLATWGAYLSSYQTAEASLTFKYWITLEIDDAPRNGTLKPASLGLLLYLKGKGEGQPLPPFHLNTSTVRVPHARCAACGESLKDWGGKKHLMNPLGTSLSDVWRDLPRTRIRNNVIPATVLSRIAALTAKEGVEMLHVIEQGPGIVSRPAKTLPASLDPEVVGKAAGKVELNRVYEGDCVAFLNDVARSHPEGVFDLVFADPPYNLKKGYGRYHDGMADREYVGWCNEWLGGMAKTLKPGGSLFVLNLPKWAIHHAAFLNERLVFRHWITWDALSDPRGKLMPAHYALLYYTKPGGEAVFNYQPLGHSPDAVAPPDSPQYCLRASCVRRRKRLGDDRKAELADVWYDIHRIKHKRDRDAHPCQLPDKLMERIILLSTKEGGVVFDPFCGAGTTALAAKKLGRNFVTIDLDPMYVRITNEKLEAMGRHTDLFGQPVLTRRPVKKKKAAASKKQIETYLQQFALELGREPTVEEIEAHNPEMLSLIDSVYPSRLAAIKRSRVGLRVRLSPGMAALNCRQKASVAIGHGPPKISRLDESCPLRGDGKKPQRHGGAE
jgi:DNA modification methylase